MGPTADDAPLHRAITMAAADGAGMAETLVSHKARLDIRNTKGMSPLSSAIRYGPTSIAKIMIKSQVDVDAEIFEGWTSLRHVFYFGHDDAYRLDGPVPSGAERWPQLRDAVGNHARVLTDLLLERGVDLNRPSAEDGWRPLVHAAKMRNLSKLRRLLTREPDPADVHLRDREGKSPLWWAVQYRNGAAVQLLAEHGADIKEPYDEAGSTPLLDAVRQADGDMAQLLVKLGADVNTRTASGLTPLIEAVKLRARDTVWVLLNAGARPDARDAAGWPALLHAIKNGDKALVWLLVAKGASAAGLGQSGSGSGEPVPSALDLALDGTEADLSTAWLLCEHGGVAGCGRPHGRNAAAPGCKARACRCRALPRRPRRGRRPSGRDRIDATALRRAARPGRRGGPAGLAIAAGPGAQPARCHGQHGPYSGHA